MTETLTPRTGKTLKHPRPMTRTALFDGMYRYTLTRVWDPAGTQLTAVMLNPSAANLEAEDPTVYGMVERAIQLGHGSLVVVNVFAAIATYSEDLYTMADPVGPENDRYILEAHQAGAMTIIGWGKHAAAKKLKGSRHVDRHQKVLAMLEAEKPVHAFQVNKDGTPKHPLYVSYATRPQPYRDLLGARES